MTGRRAAVAVLMTLAAAWGAPSGLPAQAPATRPAQQHFVLCPSCGLEMAASPEQEKKPPLCPRCGQRHVVMRFYTKSDDRPGGPRLDVRLLLAGVALAAVVIAVMLAVVWGINWIWRAQRFGRPQVRQAPMAKPVDEAFTAYEEGLKRRRGGYKGGR
jgi:hypothetical protein